MSKDDGIKICSFDKGNGVAILDTSEYFRKLNTIVLDEKFIKANYDLTLLILITVRKHGGLKKRTV